MMVKREKRERERKGAEKALPLRLKWAFRQMGFSLRQAKIRPAKKREREKRGAEEERERERSGAMLDWHFAF